MSKSKHLKASDIFEKSSPFLGTKTSSFAEAFPSIKSIEVSVREDEDMMWKMGQGHTSIFTESTLRGEYYDCSGRSCFSGGICIGDIIRDMVRSKETHRETSKRCQGYEGSPKGRRKYRNCMHMFYVKVSIIYKDADA